MTMDIRTSDEIPLPDGEESRPRSQDRLLQCHRRATKRTLLYELEKTGGEGYYDVATWRNYQNEGQPDPSDGIGK